MIWLKCTFFYSLFHFCSYCYGSYKKARKDTENEWFSCEYSQLNDIQMKPTRNHQKNISQNFSFSMLLLKVNRKRMQIHSKHYENVEEKNYSGTTCK